MIDTLGGRHNGLIDVCEMIIGRSMGLMRGADRLHVVVNPRAYVRGETVRSKGPEAKSEEDQRKHKCPPALSIKPLPVP